MGQNESNMIMEGSRYYKWCELDDSKKLCKSITFPISRYSKHMHTIAFVMDLTEDEAVKKMCKFMMEPIDEKWFDNVKDDTWTYDIDSKWESCSDMKRDELLTDCVRIESIKIDEMGNVTMFIGS